MAAQKTMKNMLAALILLTTVTTGSAVQFCLSDSDLQIVLINNAVRTFGAMSNTCAKKYPDLAQHEKAIFLEFVATYADGFAVNDRLAGNALTKAGLDEGDQRELIEAAKSEGVRTADNYTKRECQNFILGLKATAEMKDFRVIEKAALLDYKTRRSITPRCPEQTN
jgi:hypothetical protein